MAEHVADPHPSLAACWSRSRAAGMLRLAADAKSPTRSSVCSAAINSSRVRPARRRQVGRHRSPARHQGRAGGRSEDRQCGGAVVAPRLHHRCHGRADQRLFLRCRRPADRRLRPRGDARSQWHSRRCSSSTLPPTQGGRHRGLGDVILSGSVQTPAEAQTAYAVTACRSSPEPAGRAARHQGRQCASRCAIATR